MSENRIVAGTIQEFLDLSDADMSLINLKVELKEAVKNARVNANYSQTHLAELMGSSQSRIAKLEGGDSSVSIDFMLKALFSMGLSFGDLARVICPDYEEKLRDMVRQRVDHWGLGFQKRLEHLEWSMFQIASQKPSPELSQVRVILIEKNRPEWRLQ